MRLTTHSIFLANWDYNQSFEVKCYQCIAMWMYNLSESTSARSICNLIWETQDSKAMTQNEWQLLFLTAKNSGIRGMNNMRYHCYFSLNPRKEWYENMRIASCARAKTKSLAYDINTTTIGEENAEELLVWTISENHATSHVMD